MAVARALREIGQLLALEGKEAHRARAYLRGADAIEALAADLRELARAGRLTTVPGIGARLARIIEEILESGGCAMLEGLRRRYPPGALELASVLSLARIRTLHDALGITSLAELREACAAGTVRSVRGFGAATERRILDAIDAAAARGDAVLLPEATLQGARFLTHLQRSPIIARAELAGSLRRRVESIDRLDVVIASPEPDAAIAHAVRFPASPAVPQPGATHAQLRPPAGLPIHVHAVAPEAFAAAWVHATGSDAHVAGLSRRALAAGIALDADGVRRNGRILALADEPALYRALDLDFIPAELREDAGEIEAAAAGTLPDDLIEVADVQGAVHCHTLYSDGRHTIEEMARAAEALGLRYLTITDHSPTAGYAGGLSIERLRQQADEIARVQERVGIALLRGTESDILEDGALDFPDEILRELDVVIASIHARHGLDAEAMTRRLVRALRHPVFKIWGHALGRYVLTRPPLACDMERVLDAAAESRAAIEINGDPHRLDLEPRWIREARRRGIRFVISSDAHSVSGLANFRWGVDMARRGWVRRGEVLNALPAAEFRAAVHP
jgi:DNA polymerase (family 10)